MIVAEPRLVGAFSNIQDTKIGMHIGYNRRQSRNSIVSGKILFAVLLMGYFLISAMHYS